LGDFLLHRYCNMGCPQCFSMLSCLLPLNISASNEVGFKNQKLYGKSSYKHIGKPI
jgi:hypothetical protein